MTTETIAHALTPRRVLWLALATVLAASAVHVAGTFSTLEPGGALPVLARLGPYTGVLAAVAVDLGLIALSWGIGARKRAEPDKTPWGLWGGVAFFFVLSSLANFDHALTVVGARPPFLVGQTGAAAWALLDQYTRVKVIVLSASLPLLAIYLTRVIETAVDERRDTETDTEAQAVVVQRGGSLNDLSIQEQVDRGIIGPDALRLIEPVPVYANGHAVPVVDTPVHINGVGTITIPPGAPPYLPRPVRKAAPRPTGQAKLTPERYHVLYAEHVPPGTGAQEGDRIVAALAGVDAKTVQRRRLAGG